MKLKLTVLLATFVVTMGLLGAGAASAAEVKFDDLDAPNKATGIQNLDVGGKLYDVAFKVLATASEVYGQYPGQFIFDTPTAVQRAVYEVNLALSQAGATTVGDVVTVEGSILYDIGWESLNKKSDGTESVLAERSALPVGTDTWIPLALYIWNYNLERVTYAEFTPADPAITCEGDLNNDGVVDDEDFTIFIEDWGRTDCPIQ